ncbi:MAG TPA: hypothetical protein VK994_00310 [Bacteroidales bacterium]|nr:hypothetical protein [Bacteroidales bacterium]
MTLKKVFAISDPLWGDGQFKARIGFDPDHALFEGHFPGQPVVPGVVLIRIAREMTEIITGKALALHEAANVKFLNMIDPRNSGNILLKGTYKVNDDGLFQVQGSFSGNATDFARFSLLFVEKM